MKTDAFHDQVVIVTGASAGIGKALALQLAEKGLRLRRLDGDRGGVASGQVEAP